MLCCARPAADPIPISRSFGGRILVSVSVSAPNRITLSSAGFAYSAFANMPGKMRSGMFSTTREAIVWNETIKKEQK